MTSSVPFVGGVHSLLESAGDHVACRDKRAESAEALITTRSKLEAGFVSTYRSCLMVSCPGANSCVGGLPRCVASCLPPESRSCKPFRFPRKRDIECFLDGDALNFVRLVYETGSTYLRANSCPELADRWSQQPSHSGVQSPRSIKGGVTLSPSISHSEKGRW